MRESGGVGEGIEECSVFSFQFSARHVRSPCSTLLAPRYPQNDDHVGLATSLVGATTNWPDPLKEDS